MAKSGGGSVFDMSITDYVSGTKVRATPEELEAVQPFSRRLVEDLGYARERIQTRPQFRVKDAPSGEPRWPVDIAVFQDERREYDNVMMIVECKQPTRNDGYDQLLIYMNLCPATLGVWFNGTEHLYLHKRYRDGVPTYEEIATLPRAGERIEDVGQHLRSQLIKPFNLRAQFLDIRNHLAGSALGVTRDEPIAGQLVNLLFCKIHDELTTPPDEAVRFRVGYREEAASVKERILELYAEVKATYDDVFSEADSIDLDADALVYVVGELQPYCITEASRDVLGEAFEVFIGPALKGPQGQYFTPRNVVRMAVDMLDPGDDDRIIDPAAGSGGFLVVALEHVWHQIDQRGKTNRWSADRISSRRAQVANKAFRGVDKDEFLAKITKAYMALIGDGRGGVFCEDSLRYPSEWDDGTRSKIHLGEFTVVLTNPPFGAKVRVAKQALPQYDLGHKWKRGRGEERWHKTNELDQTQPPQVIFLERCLQLLKPGGRMAIVLPDGVLSNSTQSYVLQWISENACIDGVVDLPMNTFLPHTPTKTSVLFLRKAPPEDQGPIFMSVVNSCGHDKRGRPIHAMVPGSRKTDIPDEISLVAEHYHRLKKHPSGDQSRLAFLVSPHVLVPGILMPKYYNPDLPAKLDAYKATGNYKVVTIGELVAAKVIRVFRGHQPGSEHYGTGDIPFIRTSEIANWEIIADPTHCVSEEVYDEVPKQKRLKSHDVLVVNDGTYLMGRTAILSEHDTRIVLQSHFRVLRVLKPEVISPFLLLFLLGLDVVQEQIAAKCFRQGTISTLGKRLSEVAIPIPTSKEERASIETEVAEIVRARAQARHAAMTARLGGETQNVMGVINRGHMGNL